MPILTTPAVVRPAFADCTVTPNHRSALTTRRFFACSSATTIPTESPESGSVSTPTSRKFAMASGTRATKPMAFAGTMTARAAMPGTRIMSAKPM